MAKGSSFSNAFLKLLFQAVAIANIADNAASSPLTALAVALHTADPGSGGAQTTSEVAYTGYGRVTIVRTSSGWAVSSNVASPVANIDFPQCTAGTATATNFSIGTAGSGAGIILYTGPISPSISISNGVTPRLTTSTTITET